MTQEDEQIAQRRAHLAAIEALGLPAYPHRFDPADTISALVDAHEPKTSEELNASRIETVTAGRILAIRSFGKANFLVLSDGRAKSRSTSGRTPCRRCDFQISSCSTSATASASRAICSGPRPTS